MNQDLLQKRIADLKQKIDIEKLSQEIKEIQDQSTVSDFWKDYKAASLKMKRLTDLQNEIQEINELDALLKEEKYAQLEKNLQKLELKTFLSGKYDSSNVIFSIHAGQGGTEAMDWAQMLKRMYIRYFEKKGWTHQVVDETSGEEAGIKSVTITVSGPLVYGFLKKEAGTHRLVRQSPFNADKLRQTSFALVEVLPQIQETSEIKMKESDLEWQFFHSSSQGGQNVQKVSTAVRVKHLPSGMIVSCQSERYQEQNRKIALDILRAKLWQIEEQKLLEEKHKLKGGRTKAAWGTQIRSYVLHPYKMVKDLRTGYETSNPDAVLDGDLDGFIEAELKQSS